MRGRWIALVLVIAAFVGLGAFFAWQGDGDGWGRGDHEVVRTVENADGTTDTVVIERDRGFPGFFFFPFGFFLFLFVIFAIVRPLFWRGGGPWNGGSDGQNSMRERFSEWHRQEHERMDGAKP